MKMGQAPIVKMGQAPIVVIGASPIYTAGTLMQSKSPPVAEKVGRIGNPSYKGILATLGVTCV